MMIYKPSKLVYSSVHIDRVYHFIRDHFSRIPLHTYTSFHGPGKMCIKSLRAKIFVCRQRQIIHFLTASKRMS